MGEYLGPPKFSAPFEVHFLRLFLIADAAGVGDGRKLSHFDGLASRVVARFGILGAAIGRHEKTKNATPAYWLFVVAGETGLRILKAERLEALLRWKFSTQSSSQELRALIEPTSPRPDAATAILNLPDYRVTDTEVFAFGQRRIRVVSCPRRTFTRNYPGPTPGTVYRKTP